MVNTVVTFESDRISSSMTPPLAKAISTDAHAVWSRRLYLAFGILLLIVILIPTGLSIGKDRDDFAYHLLFIVHSSSYCYSSISSPSPRISIFRLPTSISHLHGHLST